MKSTAGIKVSESLVDQVVGQEKAVELIMKAAAQKRNVLLIGEPGTGKSMLAQAMAELLSVESLQDILIYPNPQDENNPRVIVANAGAGRKIVDDIKKRNFMRSQTPEDLKQGLGSFLVIGLLFALSISVAIYFKLFSDVILAALIIVGGLFTGMLLFASAFATGMKGLKMPGVEKEIGPKLLVDNSDKKIAPFIDATGARAGALLGDVRHDPYQSGGLGTPPHLRVEAGMIHRANKGVLFIDEIATLSAKSQQDLLTAIQEKKYQITGQSEMSSGAMVRTEPVPCDFLLTAAGNMADMQKMHPALRSRIRGYGYEIYLNDNMDDTPANREKILRFIAQEIKKDGKIPHFDKSAADEIIFEARRRAGRKNRLTLKLRDLGGLVRAAGDVAKIKKAKIVTREHVLEAKKLARTLEQQIADKAIDARKEYEVFKTTGFMSGKVNGLAVIGGSIGFGGILLPIEASVAPAQGSSGKTITTGKLGEIAKEAVHNVFAIIKKYKGQKLSEYDVNIQFLQTYEGVEGDSASVSVATAVISALEGLPVDQSVAMTGSLSVKGEVMPVGGVSAKIEAAIESGAKTVVIPYDNRDDVVLEPEKAKKVNIMTAQRLTDVLQVALKDSAKKTKLIADINKVIV